MKFFIDTAEFSEIKDAYSYGFNRRGNDKPIPNCES